uniref:Uncharacterized protein n=1 Tax=Kalanchoe fedtschenkoi TaxID=63787 RepID=A0A7N0V6P2_KALFE
MCGSVMGDLLIQRWEMMDVGRRERCEVTMGRRRLRSDDSASSVLSCVVRSNDSAAACTSSALLSDDSTTPCTVSPSDLATHLVLCIASLGGTISL